MNRYFALSCGLHLSLALLIMVLLSPAVKKPKTTYTIDFIGSGKVVSMQSSAKPAAAANQGAAKSEPKKEIAQAPAPKKTETPKKADKKAYQSKSEISTKKQTKKKAAPAPLAAPSILDEVDDAPKVVDTNSSQTAADSGNGGEGEFEGGNIQTDFATFPYPWYITQVRNSLWSEWESRRPVGVTMGTLVSFAIARDGKIKNLKIEKSSGDDSFDFAAKSAVINAGPFPPLPMLYDKDELTVTVEFKQER